MWVATPWFVGGGAIHSQESARHSLYTSTGGGEGIVDASDLKVTVPQPYNATVRVAPGSALIRNRYVGNAQQSYSAQNQSEDVLTLSPTSSAERRDMIIARIEDPFVAGAPWDAPADPATGQYVFTRVITNVPSSAVANPYAAQQWLRSQGWSAVALAAVTIPAMTATITPAMVTDLRSIAQPFSDTAVFTAQHTLEEDFPKPQWKGTNEPPEGNWVTDFIPLAPTLVIPDWATHMTTTYTGVLCKQAETGGMVGDIRINFGPVGNPHYTLAQSTWEEDGNTATRRFMLGAAGTNEVLPDRGLERQFRIDIRRWKWASHPPALLWTSRGTWSQLQVTFSRRPI